MKCLQKVEDGEIKRLMGLMPPSTAKSTYSSIVFPTHVMGRFTGSNIILTSYDGDLPRMFGRRARSITKQAGYQRVFCTQLCADSKAADALQPLDNPFGPKVVTPLSGTAQAEVGAASEKASSAFTG